MSSFTPASRAIASRCSTAFVEPPDAQTAMIAFSTASRVMMSRGLTLRRSTSIAARPTSNAASSLRGSMPGIALASANDMPRNSITIDIVFAVYCPPQAPAPGQAAISSVVSCSAVILPAAKAPTPSNTSRIVTSRPS